MNACPPRPLPRRPRRSGPAAFAFVESIMGVMMTAVVIAAAFTGVISLQGTYSASEQYTTGMADQMRVLDYLALDLRRALTPPVMDPDEQGIQIVVPDDYHFNSSDPQHLFPVPNVALLNAAGTTAYSVPAHTSRRHTNDCVPFSQWVDHAHRSLAAFGQEQGRLYRPAAR